MPFYAPEDETLRPDVLRAMQGRKLARLLDEIRASNTFYQRRFRGVVLDVRRDALDRLPLTTRQDIEHDQAANPPYGTNLTYPLPHYRRFHQTSGTSGAPLCWLDTAQSWDWWKHCWGVIYRAAGVTPDDRFVFPFSFGPFIGFWGAFESAVDLGNLTLPAGGMTTVARLHYLVENDVTFVGCTPTYAVRLAEVAIEQGIDLRASAVRGLIVAGEPGGHIEPIRRRIEESFDARVFDHAGMTELGPWGFECVENPQAMHVMESEFIAEVLDTKSLQPVPDGEVGELVLTNLGRLGSPLIRYRTGDLVRLNHGQCACGRWFARAEGGILGRVDDMLLIRGNNVFPSVVEGIIREFRAVAEFRLEVTEPGSPSELNISIEPARDANAKELAEAIQRTIRDRLHFTPRVTAVEPGALPRFEMKAKRWVRTGRGNGSSPART